MLDKLEKFISGADADYIDIRYEQMSDTKITLNKADVENFGSNLTDGYVIRVLRDGGFASVTVISPDDIPSAIKTACTNATLIGQNASSTMDLEFPEPIVDTVELKLDEDPNSVSMEDKIALVRHYSKISLDFPNNERTMFTYFDRLRNKYFVSSRGTKINEKTLTTGIGGIITAKKGDLSQSTSATVGGSHGFGILRNREDVFRAKAKIASELLDAEPVKGGKYNVVLDPSMTGVFVHEAFGHSSEADIVEKSPSLMEKMKIGEKLGSDIVTIIDDQTKYGQLGHYKYDDEGVPATPVTLMENGILKDRLHSMKTAKSLGANINGRCVAEDSTYAPIIRMGTIYLRPGTESLEELFEKVGNGLYILGAKGGQTSGENFTFGAQYGYKIENGKLAGMVRDINLMGNMFTTMKNITAVSKDFLLTERGGCGKGQINIKSTYGGPNTFIKDALIGGV